MSLAVIAALVILAGIMAFHLYLYRKINAAFQLHWLARMGIAHFLLLMTLAPFIARHLDHTGNPILSRVINIPTFIWIAWLFWFCMGGLLIDLWNIIIRFAPSHASRLKIPAKRQVQGLAIMILVATIWSLMEAWTPHIREITIHHPAFRSSAPIRLVQVSDVHLGTLRGPGWNRKVCQTIESLKPDILVSTGDLVDSSMRNIGAQADPWAAIPAPMGKFAILGNHEYYLGLTDALLFHRKAGFQMLRGRTVAINNSLEISGVDDNSGQILGVPCYSDESNLIPVPDRKRFHVLLKHKPTISKSTALFFNLQLSGHTHNGQLFPFRLFVMLFHQYVHGLYQPAPDFELYVSAGTGTWGPPMRLFAPPEIIVFNLTR